MLKNLFDIFMKVTDPRPRYTGSRCLVEKNVVGGCDRCFQACPHDAVRITDKIEITEACTGCGLCVQACPSGALEYDLVPVLGALKQQGVGSDEVPNPGARLKCSKVHGVDAPTVDCLGRVSPAMVMVSAAWGQKLTLLHGDCASCKLGGPSVPSSVQNVLGIVQEYRKNLSAEPIRARMLEVRDGAVVAVRDGAVVEVRDGVPLEDSVSAPQVPKPAVSRREALGSLFQGAKRGAVAVIPDQPLPGVDASLPREPVPDEWQWRKRALKPRPVEGAAQYWPAPSVNEHCIFCPVCTNVCPTNAIVREIESDGSYRLQLQVDACTGCNACVVSCPPDAMRLEPETLFERISERVVVREGFNLEGPPV
jgi:ferredoxin